MPLRRRKGAARVPRRRIRKLRLFSLLTLLGLLSLAAFTVGLVRAIASEIPALDPAHQQRIEANGYVYSSNGHSVLAVLRGSESRVLVRSKEIDPRIMQAIVAVEDKRFWQHRAVDVRGIVRAAWADLRAKNVVQGGSTITQQFIKNAYVSNDRAIGRKLREAALAWQLEQRWSKLRILTAYLNTIYFGNGAYGVQQAAVTYFHHPARPLTLAEAALLAGIPKDPSLYDPVANPREARARRAFVLRTMLDQGLVTREAFRRARHAPMPAPASVSLPDTQRPNAAQYFVNYVKQQLVDHYGSACVFGGGLRVTTSVDLRLQKLARNSIARWLGNPNGPAGALVAVDPGDGRVLAMVGGRNFRRSQFNLAVQGERQPGSAFKPFVLADALERGVSPVTRFVSKPVVIPFDNRLWSVHNYEGDYLGSIDLEAATIHSDNSVYAQLTSVVGPAAIADTAKRLGITSPLKGYLSIGLGAQAVNPLEMARAFSTFARGGVRVDGSLLGNHPRAILAVGKARNGHCGKSQLNRPVGRRAVSPRTAAYVSSILQKVVREGTGTKAALGDGRPVAGKTGTTENYGDAWFVGYTPQLATAVWVGYPKGLRPMLTEFHGDPVAGGTYPALIWKTFMQLALAYRKDAPETFPTPPTEYSVAANVVFRDGRLERDNGVCHNVRSLSFFSGSGPEAVARCKPNEVEVPQLVGSTLQAATARLRAQPLTPNVISKPAAPRQRLGVVLRQFPRGGTLSSFEKVTLVVGKPLYGIVPKVVGMSLPRARRQLERVQLDPRVVPSATGRPGRVLFQAPAGGVAAAPGMDVKLVVAGVGG